MQEKEGKRWAIEQGQMKGGRLIVEESFSQEEPIVRASKPQIGSKISGPQFFLIDEKDASGTFWMYKATHSREYQSLFKERVRAWVHISFHLVFSVSSSEHFASASLVFWAPSSVERSDYFWIDA